MSYIKAEILEVKSVDGKKTEFKVLLGTHEIGTSKSDTDARFHMHVINDALSVAYLAGQKYLERLVEKTRLEAEFQKLYHRALVEQFKERQRLEGQDEK